MPLPDRAGALKYVSRIQKLGDLTLKRQKLGFPNLTLLYEERLQCSLSYNEKLGRYENKA